MFMNVNLSPKAKRTEEKLLSGQVTHKWLRQKATQHKKMQDTFCFMNSQYYCVKLSIWKDILCVRFGSIFPVELSHWTAGSWASTFHSIWTAHQQQHYLNMTVYRFWGQMLLLTKITRFLRKCPTLGLHKWKRHLTLAVNINKQSIEITLTTADNWSQREWSLQHHG